MSKKQLSNYTWYLLSLLFLILIFCSCKKDNFPHPPNNIIRIDSMCYDNANYTVWYNQVTVNTEQKTFAMSLSISGKDTFDIHQQITGIGTHSVVLNTKESGCGVIIRIVNGQLSVNKYGNCKLCKY